MNKCNTGAGDETESRSTGHLGRTLHLGKYFRKGKSSSSYSSAKGQHRYEPEVCRVAVRTPEFYLKSPNYPQTYPTAVDCVYVVERLSPSTCSVQIEFVDFQLETSPSCQADYLLIARRKYCGLQPRHKSTTFFFFSFLLSFILHLHSFFSLVKISIYCQHF